MDKRILLLPLMLSMLTTSCANNNTPQPADDGVIMMNSFEDMSQLSLMKFPFPKHSDRGRFDLSDEHVTHGKKSLKYTNDYGNYVEVCHYFTNLLEPGIDTSDIKSIELDIFNDSDFDSTCSLMIYATEDMSTLLTQSFDLKAKEMTHISFELSKVAIEFNYESMICSSLKLYTLNTNYDKGIGYTYYLDNWHAVMGSSYTEEDLLYKPVLDDIKARIDTLPRSENITTDHTETLKGIAKDISVLPDLYRRAVPNITHYNEALQGYYNYMCAITTIDYDLNTFLKLNEFYGSVQLQPDVDTSADVFYCEEVWPGESEARGCTKIAFGGNIDNKFIYNSEANLNDFDFINFKIYNGSNNKIRVWVSYGSNAYFDIEPGTVREAKFSSRLLANQFFWAFLHLRGASDDTVINSSGYVLIDEVYVTGRSQETRKNQLLATLNKLPALNSINTEDDYIKAITTVKTAKQLFNDVLDKSDLDQSKINLLYALEDKIDHAGYGLAYNAYSDPMKRLDYGEDFDASTAKEDAEFGYVSVAHMKGCPSHPDSEITHEQGFSFANATDTSGNYGGFIIYIFNPTQDIYHFSVRDTSWKWDTTYPFWTNIDVVPGWNKIEITLEVITASDDKKVMFLANDKSLDNDFAGDWLFSSLVGVPRKL